MLKRFLAAAALTSAIVLSAGTSRLMADCYIECEFHITDDYIIVTCGPVWCDDGEGG